MIHKTQLYLLITELFLLAGVLFAQQETLYKVKKDIHGNAQNAGEQNTITFIVYKNDQQQYQIEKNVDYDIPVPSFKVFNDGSAVLINAFEANLTFNDKTGNQIAKINILNESDVFYERTVYSALSDMSVVIALDQPGMDYLLIQLYSNSGKFINQFRVNEKNLNGISLSANADLIALSVYEWPQDILTKSTLFLNSAGNLISRINADFNTGDFIEEQPFFIGYSNKQCFVYNLDDKSVFFSKISPDDLMILSAKIVKDQIIVIEAKKPSLKNGKWYYQDPILSYYKQDGHIINRKTVESPPFAEYRILSKDKQLIFKMPDQSVRIDR